MNVFKIIEDLESRKIDFELTEANKIKIIGKSSVIDEQIIQLIEKNRKEIVELLICKKLNIGTRVSCPAGTGRVWEVYPSIGRCGVVFDRNSLPWFYSVWDVKVVSY